MNRKQIIIIPVLGILAFILGCKPNANQIGNVANPNPVEPKPDPVGYPEREENMIGTYEMDLWGETGKQTRGIVRYVLLTNGLMEHYLDGKKDAVDYTWSIVDSPDAAAAKEELKMVHNEVHIVWSNGEKDAPSAMADWTLPGKFNAGDVQIYRVNPDNSISRIADIYRNGKRTDYPEEQQFKLKKIN